jgi:hypothetical protein
MHRHPLSPLRRTSMSRKSKRNLRLFSAARAISRCFQAPIHAAPSVNLRLVLAIRQAACSDRLQMRNSTQRLLSLAPEVALAGVPRHLPFYRLPVAISSFFQFPLSRHRRCAINSTPVLGETRIETGYLQVSSALKSQVRSCGYFNSVWR